MNQSLSSFLTQLIIGWQISISSSHFGRESVASSPLDTKP